jgi:hypothetical protein
LFPHRASVGRPRPHAATNVTDSELIPCSRSLRNSGQNPPRLRSVFKLFFPNNSQIAGKRASLDGSRLRGLLDLEGEKDGEFEWK